MIKYKHLRLLAATGWGCVAMILTLCALWAFTKLPIQDVIFWMIMIYLVTVGIILWFTETPSERGTFKKNIGQQKTTQKKIAAKKTMPIYTWNKGVREWIRS